MELENLINKWNDLNEHLDKIEVLNKKVLYDMLKSKADSALEKLRKYEMLTILGGIVVLISIIYLRYAGLIPARSMVMVKTAMILLPLFLIWSSYKYYFLSKLFIGKLSIIEIQRLFCKYKLWLKYEGVVSYPIVAIILVQIVLRNQLYNYPNLIYLMLLVLVIICLLTIFVSRFVNKKIRIIHSTLIDLDNIATKN